MKMHSLSHIIGSHYMPVTEFMRELCRNIANRKHLYEE